MNTSSSSSSSSSNRCPNSPIRLILVEDHTIVREGTRELLEQEDDLTIQAAVGSAEEALICVANLQPDIVLVDLHLPDMDGISLVQAIAKTAPAIRTIMLSAFGDPVYVMHAFAAGASGYLLKTASSEELVAAVRSVAAGSTVIDRSLPQLLSTPAPSAVPHVVLSHREQEILALLVDGQSNKEISQSLNLSVRTVESYASHLYVKLNVRTRTEAVLASLKFREGSAGENA